MINILNMSKNINLRVVGQSVYDRVDFWEKGEVTQSYFPPFELFPTPEDAEKAGCHKLAQLMREGKCKSPIVSYKPDPDDEDL